MALMAIYFTVGFMMNAADQQLPADRQPLLPPLADEDNHEAHKEQHYAETTKSQPGRLHTLTPGTLVQFCTQS